MKTTLFLIVGNLWLLLFYSCHNDEPRALVMLDPQDTLVTNEVTTKTPAAQPDADNWHFTETLSDPSTLELAKNIYKGKELNLNQDRKALALLDSLNAKDTTARPFYFKVITMAKTKSSGPFSKGLATHGRDYVENHTREFVHYFTDSTAFPDRDLDTWVDIIMLDFSMKVENNNKPNSDMEDFVKTLRSNCKLATPAEKEMVNKFALKLSRAYKDYLSHL